MSRVGGITGKTAIAGSQAKAPTGPGEFNVASGIPVEDLSQAEAPPPVGLAGMLALQEAVAESAGNRQAKRHGFALLDALRELQRGLLGAAVDREGQIAGLNSLAGAIPSVVDPGLRDLLSAIRLRAKIELLRRGVETD